MDDYGCDGCGNRLPFDDIRWFTSTVGFCPDCNTLLHKRVPQCILDFCYDEVEGGNDEVAEFLANQVR